MTTAAIESELFLWRHPWASTIDGRKTYTYRCPAHPEVVYSRMSGDPLPAERSDKTTKKHQTSGDVR